MTGAPPTVTAGRGRELQDVHLGDPINTGSVGSFAVGNPVTVLEPNRAFVAGAWAFVLRPLPGDRTRLLVRERDEEGAPVGTPSTVSTTTSSRS